MFTLFNFLVLPQVSQTHNLRNQSIINNLCLCNNRNVTLSAVVKKMVTRCGGQLKPPVVKRKQFKLEQKGGKFFQAYQKWGQMDYPSLHWRGKSSSGFEFWQENGLMVQGFLNHFVQPCLCLQKAVINTSNPPAPKTKKQAKWTTEARQGDYIILIYFIQKKVTFYFIARFYPSLFLL